MLDSAPLQSLVSPECKACKNMTDSISSWKAKEYRYVGEYVSPTYVAISAFPNDTSAKVFVTSRTQESKLLDSKNSVVQTFPPDNSNVSIFLLQKSGQWIVSEIKSAA
jgi:hypothetical protein